MELPRRRGGSGRTPRRAGRVRPVRSAGSAGTPSHGLTTRAAVLGLVLCALVVSAAFPLRTYLAQRGRIATMEQSLVVQRARVAELEQVREQLGDPAYVAGLARERLHYVRPGETAYVVLGPETGAGAAERGAGRAPQGPEAAWWSQLWGTVRAADGPPSS